jgi:hypothetical protein
MLNKSASIQSNDTCYLHLNCMRNHFSWCLDWREICDGKVDCWPNPVDEEYCNILEQNECSPNEYRCRNGQCIPKAFILDDNINTDCLDGSDEHFIHIMLNSQPCIPGDPSFRCTDLTYPHWLYSFCPGGYCYAVNLRETDHYKQFHGALLMRKFNSHLTDECWATMICFIQQFSLISLVSIENDLMVCCHFSMIGAL